MMITTAVIQQFIDDKVNKTIGLPGTKGLQISFTDKGTPSFKIRYTSPVTKKSRSYVFGKFGTKKGRYTLAQAKDECLVLATSIKRGNDPHILTAPKNEPLPIEVMAALQPQGITVDRFLNAMHDVKKTEDLSKGYMKLMNSVVINVKRDMGGMLVTDITRRIAQDYIKKIMVIWTDEQGRKRGGHRTASHVKSIMSMFWNTCIDEGANEEMMMPDLVNNPWRVSKKLRKALKAGTREVYLDADDLSVLLTKMPVLDKRLIRGLMTMLYTGVRPNEATKGAENETGFDWSEIRWMSETWSIPAWRMKTRIAHVVPISSQYMRLLRAWHEEDGKPDTGPVIRSAYGNTLCRIEFGRFIKNNDLGFTAHTVRKTVRTHLSQLGCSFEVAEAVLAHLPQGVSARYNFHDNIVERREWLQKWADKLDDIAELSVVDAILNNDCNHGTTRIISTC